MIIYYSISEMSIMLNKKYKTLHDIIKRSGIVPCKRLDKLNLYSIEKFNLLSEFISKNCREEEIIIYAPYYVREEFHIYESKINKK